MNTNFKRLSVLFIAIMFVASFSEADAFQRRNQQPQPEIDLSRIKLPPGFEISIYASGVRRARSLALSPSGVVYAGSRTMGSRGAGYFHAVVDSDRDHKADKVIQVATGLFQPNGVAFKDGDLYVAEINRILKYENIETYLENSEHGSELSLTPKVIYDKLSDKTHHGWKYLEFGPDGKLYFAIGAPSNSEEHELPFATISSINTDGSNFEIFAYGVRQSVGFDWDPRTNELWFTDNGRDDWYGRNNPKSNLLPPDELNHATRKGQHFGFPYFFGTEIPDPVHGKKRKLEEFEPTAMDLAPHAAAIGMKFYTGNMFPAEYKNQIFIAEHGSWNITRGTKFNGYRITLVKVENNKAVSYETFADGWLLEDGRRRFGRPVDIEIMPDGSMLVSDDHANVIYRITYKGDN